MRILWFFQILSMFFPWKRTSLSRLSLALSRSNCREHSRSSTEKRHSPSTRGDSARRVVTVVISFQSSQCHNAFFDAKNGDFFLFNTRIEWKLWRNVKECEGMWRKPRIWRSRRNATLTKFGWYSILSCGMLWMWIKLLKICLNIISDGKFYPYPSTDDRWNSQQIEPSQGDVSSLKLTGTSGRVQETQGFSRFLMACTSQICWGGSTFISP
jgi:hypothetical protein